MAMLAEGASGGDCGVVGEYGWWEVPGGGGIMRLKMLPFEALRRSFSLEARLYGHGRVQNKARRKFGYRIPCFENSVWGSLKCFENSETSVQRQPHVTKHPIHWPISHQISRNKPCQTPKLNSTPQNCMPYQLKKEAACIEGSPVIVQGMGRG